MGSMSALACSRQRNPQLYLTGICSDHAQDSQGHIICLAALGEVVHRVEDHLDHFICIFRHCGTQAAAAFRRP